jgi:hypothetical protein
VRSKRERPNDFNRSRGAFHFFTRSLSWLTVFVTCLICPPVGTPAKMSAQVRLNIDTTVRRSIVFQRNHSAWLLESSVEKDCFLLPE